MPSSGVTFNWVGDKLAIENGMAFSKGWENKVNLKNEIKIVATNIREKREEELIAFLYKSPFFPYYNNIYSQLKIRFQFLGRNYKLKESRSFR